MDILNPQEVAEFIKETKTSQNIERKELVDNGHRIANGELDFFVKERLKELWAQSYQWFRRPNASLTQKVLSRIGKGYDEPPERKTGNEKQDVYYNELITNGDASLNKAMAEFDKTYILDDYAAVWVSLIQEEEEKKYVFRCLNQSQFDRKVNRKTLETEAVMVSMTNEFQRTRIHGDGVENEHAQDEPEDSQKEYYALWNKTHHALVAWDLEKEEVFYEEIEGNEQRVNPIAPVIPFVFEQVGDVTRLPARPSLPINDVELNSCKAVLLTGCDVRALGKLIVKHPAKQKIPQELYDSPFTFLDLPQSSDPEAAETTAEYINDTTNVAEFKDIIEAYENSLLEQEGISAGSVGNVKFTSAEDRELALKTENDRIKRNQSKYSNVEKGVFDIVKAYENSLQRTELNAESLDVRYPKQQPVKSRSQLLDEIEKEIKLGTIEPWEKHVRLNPNMTREEAEKKEEIISKIKQENFENFQSSFNITGDSDDNADQEDES
jgi:hypothetical protein